MLKDRAGPRGTLQPHPTRFQMQVESDYSEYKEPHLKVGNSIFHAARGDAWGGDKAALPTCFGIMRRQVKTHRGYI